MRALKLLDLQVDLVVVVTEIVTSVEAGELLETFRAKCGVIQGL